ncbi:MAG: hypothetical protein H7834_04940 [Magnetococcus sp. YQC-9]
MRILMLLTLAIACLVGLIHGIGLVWRALHPPSAPPPLPVPSWLEGRIGRILLMIVVSGLLFLVMEDLFTTRKDPGEHQPPPRLSVPVAKER